MIAFGAMVACGERADVSTPPAKAVIVVVDAAIVVDAAPPDAPCSVPPRVATQLPNPAACRVDADCAITDVAAECTGCATSRPYATSAVALAARTKECAATPAPCAIYKCPARDATFAAFFSARCISKQCVLMRTHDGG